MMMKTFLRQSLWFLLYFLGISAMLFIVGSLTGKMDTAFWPAPQYSDSYSFNEKLSFLRDHQSKQATYVVGSSMCLNNFSGQAYAQRTGDSSLMNIASWGLSVKDSYLWLSHLAQLHQPRHVILLTNYVDFCQVNKQLQLDDAISYLHSDQALSRWWQAIKHFNLKYCIKNFSYARRVRTESASYEYLGFDAFGCVNLIPTGFQVDSARWSDDHLMRVPLDEQYAYFDSISAYCFNHQISFTCLQSPYRAGLYSAMSGEKKQRLHDHIQRIQSIVTARGQSFIDANNQLWGDSLFVDGTHLNADGAASLTHFLIEEREP